MREEGREEGREEDGGEKKSDFSACEIDWIGGRVVCEEGKDGSWYPQLYALDGIIPSDGSNKAVEEGGEENSAFCMNEEMC